MDMLKYKDVIQEGDLVIVYLSVRNMYPITVKQGGVFQSKYGALKHSDVIGKKYGSVIDCSRGWVHVLFPTPELWTVTLPHRTQILYSTDISLIIVQLDLKPGSIVCEAGTGSGSLSHSLARTISPNGYLYSFDFHEQRVEIAQKEFDFHGLSKLVKVQHRDVSSDGFGVQHMADAVFLDLPQPWDVIPFVADAMKLQGGRICSFSPCIEQVQRACLALKSYGFKDITTVECLQRQYEVKKVTVPTLKPEVNNTTSQEKPCCGDAMEVELSSNDNPMASHSSLQTDMSPDKQTSKEAFWAAMPPLQTPGHTGYLTFATLLSRESESAQKINTMNAKND